MGNEHSHGQTGRPPGANSNVPPTQHVLIPQNAHQPAYVLTPNMISSPNQMPQATYGVPMMNNVQGAYPAHSIHPQQPMIIGATPGVGSYASPAAAPVCTQPHPGTTGYGGWNSAVDPASGQTFYINSLTNQTSWVLPQQGPVSPVQYPAQYPPQYPPQYPMAAVPSPMPSRTNSTIPIIGATGANPQMPKAISCHRCASTHIGVYGCVRYRCIHCEGVFSLCGNCEELEWKQPKQPSHCKNHVFILVGATEAVATSVNSKLSISEEKVTQFLQNLNKGSISHASTAKHVGSKCDKCGTKDFEVTKYKCANCPISLCENCWKIAPFHAVGHCFFKLRTNVAPFPDAATSPRKKKSPDSLEDEWQLLTVTNKKEVVSSPAQIYDYTGADTAAKYSRYQAPGTGYNPSYQAQGKSPSYYGGEESKSVTNAPPLYPSQPSSPYNSNNYGSSKSPSEYSSFEYPPIKTSQTTPYGIFDEQIDPAGDATPEISNLDSIRPEGYVIKEAKETVQNTEFDWNSKWQDILHMNFDSVEDHIKQAGAAMALQLSFAKAATKVGKIIVEEFKLPVHRKTIKPVNVGGEAGGEKYLHDGIFFKFALDIKGFYGGNELAAKSASHELKGLCSYMDFIQNSKERNLNVPIMILIDYKGYRLVASSCLPIAKNTLLYGSDDAAKTVHADDAELNKIMESAAKYIGMKPHVVGAGDQAKTIYGPADIEGHRGRDGKLYVVDTARLFSPEKPSRVFLSLHLPLDRQSDRSLIHEIELPIVGWEEAVAPYTGMEFKKCMFAGGFIVYSDNGAVNQLASILAGRKICGDALVLPSGFHGKRLYNLFRPEFSRSYPIPLSSDSFTGFGRNNATEHHNEVRGATSYLMEKLVPGLAQKLDSHVLVPAHSYQIVQYMHSEGINVRYLGFLRSLSKNSRIRSLLAVEIITRATKDMIRDLMRQSQDWEELRQQIVRQFNLILGNGHKSEVYWNVSIRVQILAKFGGYNCTIWNESEAKDMKSLVPKLLLLHNLQKAVGVEFDPHIYDIDFSLEDPLSVNDIASVFPRVKWIQPPHVLFNILQKRILNNRMQWAQQANREFRDLLTLELKQRLADAQICSRLFGEKSFEVISLNIQAASLQEKLGDVGTTMEILSRCKSLMSSRQVPLELVVGLHYLTALCHINSSNRAGAIKALETTLKCMHMLAFHDSRIQDTSIVHPFALIVLNKLVQLLVDEGRDNQCANLCEEFVNLWSQCSFSGIRQLQREIFGRCVPIPLALALETNENLRKRNAENLDQLSSQNREKLIASANSWMEQIDLLDRLLFLTVSPRIPLDDMCLPKSANGEGFYDRGNSSSNFLVSSSERALATGNSIVHCNFTEVVIGQQLEIKYKTPLNVPNVFLRLELHELNIDNMDAVDSMTSQCHSPLAAFQIAHQNTSDVRGQWLLETAKLKKEGGYAVLLVAHHNQNFDVRTRDVRALAVFYAFQNSLPSTLLYHYKTEERLFYPVPILKNTEVFSVAVGEYMDEPFFLTATATGVYSWGRGNEGQLGHGDSQSRWFPCLIKALAGRTVTWVACSSGFKSNKIPPHVMAVTNKGDIYSWGGGTRGELGHGNRESRSLPRVIQALEGVPICKAVCGAGFSAALSNNNKIFVWGTTMDDNMQEKIQLYPKELVVPAALMKIREEDEQLHEQRASVQHSKDLSKSSGTYQQEDGYQTLGFSQERSGLGGSVHSSAKPVKFRDVALGVDFGIAISIEGDVWAWGNISSLPNVPSQGCTLTKAPKLLKLLLPFAISSVSSGNHHIALLTQEGLVIMLGRGAEGQLGNDDFTSSKIDAEEDAPQLIPELSAMDKSQSITWSAKSFMEDQSEAQVLELPNGCKRGISVCIAGSDRTACLDENSICFTWGNGKSMPRAIQFLQRKKYVSLLAVSNKNMLIWLSPNKLVRSGIPGEILKKRSKRKLIASETIFFGGALLPSGELMAGSTNSNFSAKSASSFDVESWLSSFFMGEYTENFNVHGLDDAEVIKALTDKDLENIGISVIGHRKKILLRAQKLEFN